MAAFERAASTRRSADAVMPPSPIDGGQLTPRAAQDLFAAMKVSDPFKYRTLVKLVRWAMKFAEANDLPPDSIPFHEIKK